MFQWVILLWTFIVGGPVPFVIVALARQRAPIGKLQIALAALQGLDRGLFIDRKNKRVFRRIEVKPDNLGGFRRKIGIVAFAPAFAGREIDVLSAEKAPDILHVHIAKGGRNQGPRPARKAVGHGAVENGQDAFVRLPGVFGIV